MSTSSSTVPADGRPGQQFVAETLLSGWNALREPTQNRRGVRPYRWLPFLLVGGLAGGLAIVSALGACPALAAARLGLSGRATFLLLAGGVYLVTTALYAACKTHALRDLDRAPWDVRLMACVNLAVGGLVVLTCGIVALALVAILLALSMLGAALLGSSDRDRESGASDGGAADPNAG